MVGNAAISFRHFTIASIKPQQDLEESLNRFKSNLLCWGFSLYKIPKIPHLLSQIMLRLHLRQQPSPS